MGLLVIGGHERMEKDYYKMAKNMGFKPKIYTTMSSQVKNSIGSPDAIIIMTSTVSHKLTKIVENQAKKMNIPIFRHKNSSKVAFSECLNEINVCLGNCENCKRCKNN
ncbi:MULTISPECIES: DUF2325 domain-containing protein [Peptostreptococcus]|uniref:DUF2325 domain-containing protein n=1 Tax=Peptostreptococcus porci TaxID=2652282 RepID=A0A6N7X2E6_9FIRM|nr:MULTISPECIES: DUF2325 domain-containing protein [Peptostreptococcus]MDD7183398.1 DUF2325 domain-containing protein [Peptostreptococcus porci]MDY2794415.1 DUF2325 domain-containing protein [Peptostreptococcus porci]MDY4128038.1 DUF2325 domain-containing protein [Peptostreptococcus porci]MDY4560187.1 DUF2325 domain-containing protein [Peptostreptococcus porci]MDY5435893.1 DUF2325 domain-containing protein [Peptostreptococcus porci]